jgi:hypothetical protein
MRKTIVGMLSSYHSLVQSDWLWNQSPHPFGIWGDLQILAKAPHPDFLLLYNFHDYRSTRPKGWLARLQPTSNFSPQHLQNLFRGVPQERILSLVREPPFPEKLSQRQFDYQQAQKYCGFVSGPDDLAPVPAVMPAIWYVDRPFPELDRGPIPEKLRSCSWVTSGISRTVHHRQRLAFLKRLRESNLEFDLYGRDLPTWANGQGIIANKWHAMAPYYYNLAIENYAENDWYVSEKLWDALLSWCLPIYYGGTAADRLLPPGSFLRLPSLDAEGVNFIQTVTCSPDAWYAAKEAIAEARQIILHKLNLVNWLSEFIAQANL